MVQYAPIDIFPHVSVSDALENTLPKFALHYPKLVRKIVLASGSAGPIRNREDVFPKHIKDEIGIGTS